MRKPVIQRVTRSMAVWLRHFWGQLVKKRGANGVTHFYGAHLTHQHLLIERTETNRLYVAGRNPYNPQS
jgi:hypothetical protein